MAYGATSGTPISLSSSQILAISSNSPNALFSQADIDSVLKDKNAIYQDSSSGQLYHSNGSSFILIGGTIDSPIYGSTYLQRRVAGRFVDGRQNLTNFWKKVYKIAAGTANTSIRLAQLGDSTAGIKNTSFGGFLYSAYGSIGIYSFVTASGFGGIGGNDIVSSSGNASSVGVPGNADYSFSPTGMYFALNDGTTSFTPPWPNATLLNTAAAGVIVCTSGVDSAALALNSKIYMVARPGGGCVKVEWCTDNAATVVVGTQYFCTDSSQAGVRSAYGLTDTTFDLIIGETFTSTGIVPVVTAKITGITTAVFNANKASGYGQAAHAATVGTVTTANGGYAIPGGSAFWSSTASGLVSIGGFDRGGLAFSNVSVVNAFSHPCAAKFLADAAPDLMTIEMRNDSNAISVPMLATNISKWFDLSYGLHSLYAANKFDHLFWGIPQGSQTFSESAFIAAATADGVAQSTVGTDYCWQAQEIIHSYSNSINGVFCDSYSALSADDAARLMQVTSALTNVGNLPSVGINASGWDGTHFNQIGSRFLVSIFLRETGLYSFIGQALSVGKFRSQGDITGGGNLTLDNGAGTATIKAYNATGGTYTSLSPTAITLASATGSTSLVISGDGSNALVIPNNSIIKGNTTSQTLFFDEAKTGSYSYNNTTGQFSWTLKAGGYMDFASFNLYTRALLQADGGIKQGLATKMIESTVAMNNGAAAAAGTLTNAPVAGNPTKWIPIVDNGTTRYIPCW